MSDEDLATKLAEAAWIAYSKGVGGRSFDGSPLPTWQEMAQDQDKRRQLVVSAWKLASLAVVEQFVSELENHHRFFKQTSAPSP